MLTVFGVNANIKKAIESLAAEEERLQRDIDVAQSRLQTVRSALAPLRQLASEAEATVVSTEISEVVRVRDIALTSLALPDAIRQLLIDKGPMAASDIAREVLARGYKTTSADFPNVVGTTLRKAKGDRFSQDEQGRWSVLDKHQLHFG